MHWEGTIGPGTILAFLNLVGLIVGFVFYFGALRQQLISVVQEQREMRQDLSKHIELDDRLFRDINAGLNRLLGRQEATDTQGLLQKILDLNRPV